MPKLTYWPYASSSTQRIKIENGQVPRIMEENNEKDRLKKTVVAANARITKEATSKPMTPDSDAAPDKSKKSTGKDLKSLGYSLALPINWSRIQLPMKPDIYQEFYRRVQHSVDTDMVINVGKVSFNCYRVILRMCSGYFKKVNESVVELPEISSVNSGPSEASTRCLWLPRKGIQASKVSPQSFQTIYEWMIYTGPDIPKLLKRENVLDIFNSAQFLAIKDLEEQCWAFIQNEDLFDEDTAFALFQQANKAGVRSVADLMVPRIRRFFLPLVASSDFLNLSIEEILPLLKSDKICVTCEMEVFLCAVRWLHGGGDWAARRPHVLDVMRCVRFGLISPWQLIDMKRNKDNPEIMQVMQEQEVQNMVDDGLAHVIIRHWYGADAKKYYKWIESFKLMKPVERNWIGEEKNHTSYKSFLSYLEQFQLTKELMYQQFALQHTPRSEIRSEGYNPGAAVPVMPLDSWCNVRTEDLDLGRLKPEDLQNKDITKKEQLYPFIGELFNKKLKSGGAEQNQLELTNNPEKLANNATRGGVVFVQRMTKQEGRNEQQKLPNETINSSSQHSLVNESELPSSQDMMGAAPAATLQDCYSREESEGKDSRMLQDPKMLEKVIKRQRQLLQLLTDHHSQLEYGSDCMAGSDITPPDSLQSTVDKTLGPRPGVHGINESSEYGGKVVKEPTLFVATAAVVPPKRVKNMSSSVSYTNLEVSAEVNCNRRMKTTTTSPCRQSKQPSIKLIGRRSNSCQQTQTQHRQREMGPPEVMK